MEAIRIENAPPSSPVRQGDHKTRPVHVWRGTVDVLILATLLLLDLRCNVSPTGQTFADWCGLSLFSRTDCVGVVSCTGEGRG